MWTWASASPLIYICITLTRHPYSENSLGQMPLKRCFWGDTKTVSKLDVYKIINHKEEKNCEGHRYVKVLNVSKKCVKITHSHSVITFSNHSNQAGSLDIR